ncbi:hypothetical protein J1614_010937 [Plenodomus biglobosus]|nr:hypothetical protein J1614_010937 [Plenodomus biglobosus]
MWELQIVRRNNPMISTCQQMQNRQYWLLKGETSIPGVRITVLIDIYPHSIKQQNFSGVMSSQGLPSGRPITAAASYTDPV